MNSPTNNVRNAVRRLALGWLRGAPADGSVKILFLGCFIAFTQCVGLALVGLLIEAALLPLLIVLLAGLAFLTKGAGDLLFEHHRSLTAYLRAFAMLNLVSAGLLLVLWASYWVI